MPIVRPVLSVVARSTTAETVGPYVGTIEPRYETPLSFQTSGRVLARPVKVGDTVTKGQLLASLDASQQQFTLTSAEANLASAQSQFNNLSAAEERAKSLVASGTAAQSQLDTATTARQTAEAQFSEAKASLARAQDQLGYASINAGFDGVVISVGADVGQVVSAGQTVVTIARPDVREAVFELPEAQAGMLPKDAQLAISVVGAVEEIASGTVRDISPLINGSTRTQTVRLTMAAPPASFRLGTTVNVTYQRQTKASVVLPATALLEQDGKTLVWVVDPKALTVATKQVAVKTDSQITLSGGVSDGERVVVAGVHSLAEGQAVKLDDGEPQ